MQQPERIMVLVHREAQCSFPQVLLSVSPVYIKALIRLCRETPMQEHAPADEGLHKIGVSAGWGV